jgi:hypothetical protein
MTHRVLIPACLIITLASLSLSWLVWHQSNQTADALADETRRLAQIQSTNHAQLIELLTSSRTTSAEMLKQLQTMAKAAQSPQSADWIPVSFKLTLETPDGPPAVGYQVTLQKGSSGLFEQGIRRESDSAGLVDFGVVQPGDWAFELSRSWDEGRTWTCQGKINVLPATKVTKTIVCPRPQTATAGVKLRVQWPADLAEKNLRIEVKFVQTPTEFQPPLKWKVVGSLGLDRLRTILCGPGPEQVAIGGTTKLDLWTIIGLETLDHLEAQPVFGDLHRERVRSESDAVAMELGSYVPESLIALRPIARQNAAKKGERFEVVTHAAAYAGTLSCEVKSYALDPDVRDSSPATTTFSLTTFKGGVTVAPSYWSQPECQFSVRPGQVNEWTLPLPQELIDVVRERLQRKEKPQAEQPRPSTGPNGVPVS